MKTLRLSFLPLAALCGLAALSPGAFAAPRSNALRSQLEMSVKRALSNQQITKPGLDAPDNAPINTVDKATQATMLASVSRLGESNMASKDFSATTFNFSRGAKFSKTTRKSAAGFKTNTVRAKTSAGIQSSLRASNLRKLPMTKTF